MCTLRCIKPTNHDHRRCLPTDIAYCATIPTQRDVCFGDATTTASSTLAPTLQALYLPAQLKVERSMQIRAAGARTRMQPFGSENVPSLSPLLERQRTATRQ